MAAHIPFPTTPSSLTCRYRFARLRVTVVSQDSRSAQPQVDVQAPTGLGPEQLKLFPTLKAADISKEAEEGGIGPSHRECAVCLTEYGAEDVLKKLPQCGHWFHSHCIDAWLRKKASCPICRTGIEGPCEKWETSTEKLTVASHRQQWSSVGGHMSVPVDHEDRNNRHSAEVQSTSHLAQPGTSQLQAQVLP